MESGWFRRLFGLHNKLQIPATLWNDCIARLPFLQHLQNADLDRLKTLSETLLEKKAFAGAAGFELGDDIAVLIAAQASLPVLNLTLDLYQDLAGVIVYPGAFIIPQSEMDEAGVMHEWREPVSGEAIHDGGAVVLSWQDIDDNDTPGHNVVIHEFVHKIDMKDGIANGCPPFLADFHSGMKAGEWQRAFSLAYKDFLALVEELEEKLPENFNDDNPAHAARYDELSAALPLDPYAARHPAEFFAVASEAFFVLPQPLAATYPEIYRLLSLYYRQDPLKQF